MSWDILPKANLQYFLQKLKGKLDAIRQGHVIIADGGTSLPQEDNLQFGGAYVHDDSTNGKTKVDVVREFQSVAEIEALTGEAKKGFEVIEDNEEYIPYTGSDILFDNTDTSFEGENVQEVLKEVDTALDDLATTSVTSIQFTNSKCNPVYPIDCKRNGNVVTISTIINPTSTISPNEILATLPEGYRPSNNFGYFTCSHDVVIQARANGELRVSDISPTITSGYYGVNLTFVV